MQPRVHFIAAAAALQLLLLPLVSATQVSTAKAIIDPRDLVLNKVGVKLTFAFTPTTTLPSNGTITIGYSPDFYAIGITPVMDSCSLPLLSSAFAPTDSHSIVITTTGASINSGVSFTITIGGLKVGSTPTSTQFYVSTSTDTSRTNADGSYSSASQATLFSMTIANAERIFSSAVTVTIAFTPSTAISTSGSITLFFPAGMFQNSACSFSSCPFSFKSSISNAFLSSSTGSSQFLVISNRAQSSPPTGAVIPANSPFTITISGLILGPPRGSMPNSVFVSTSSDTAWSDAVASGSIALGSYVNGSCPYGMGWRNAANACTSCSSPSTGLICDDFSECFSCTACPYGQFIRTVETDTPPPIFGPPSTLMFYACSNSSSRCPAGSGKLYGDNGGCSPCPYDMYNDGSSDRCQYCPSGTYPAYSIMKASVQLQNLNCGSSGSDNAPETGFVMKRSAASCSSQCPAGTGILSDVSIFTRSAFNCLWGNVDSYGRPQTPFPSPQSGKGCFPCTGWMVSKGNICTHCNEGAYSDRFSLNSMGDSFAFASRCTPDICPWPYVLSPALTPYRIGAYGISTSTAANAPPTLEFCTSIHLGGTNVTVAVIAIMMFSTYAVAISFVAMGQDEALTTIRRRKLVAGMLMTTVIPAVDFVSDLMYIVSTLFYDNITCIFCCFFYLLPMFFFWRMLVKHDVHFGFYIGKPPAFAVMDKYDSIPKALLGFIGHVPLYVINMPVLLPLFLAGHVLYCCKVFPISHVSNLWLRLYTRSSKHTSSVNVIIPMLQESIFEHVLTISLPQMIIQITNNLLNSMWPPMINSMRPPRSNSMWPPLSIFSTAMSSVMILNVWRLVYYRIYLRMKIDAIPTDLSNDVFTFASIQEGENPLGKSHFGAKVAIPTAKMPSGVYLQESFSLYDPLLSKPSAPVTDDDDDLMYAPAARPSAAAATSVYKPPPPPALRFDAGTGVPPSIHQQIAQPANSAPAMDRVPEMMTDQ